MAQESRPPRPLSQMHLTILDQVMELREGDRLMDWAPEPVLIMQVFLALANPKHEEEAGEVKGGKRQAALASSMNLRRFDLGLRDLVRYGYLEASERANRTVSFEVEGEEMTVVLPPPPDLVAGHGCRIDSRTVSFEVEDSGMGPVRLKGLIDDEVVWSRTYETFPARSYRLTAKGREAWDRRPTDLIRVTVACKDYVVTPRQIYRHVAAGRLVDYRRRRQADNCPLLVSRAEVAALFARRS